MAEFIRLSTRDYVRKEDVDGDGAKSPVKYRGDLGEEQAVTFSRQLSFWPWGPSSGTMSTGVITVDNRGGRYDQLIYRDLRDQPITVRIPTKGGGSIMALTAIVDRIEAQSDREVLVHLKDRLTLLDIPLQPTVYGDDADPGVKDRPLPILLGVGRSIKPQLWEAQPADEDGPALRIHDAGLSGMTNVRDKGVTLLATGSPIGFKLDPRIGNAGIILGEDPSGVVTVDASSSGDAIIPPSTSDALNDTAQFDTDFPRASMDDQNAVTGWTFYGRNATGTEEHETPDFEPKTYTGKDGGYLNGGLSQDGRAILTSNTKVLEAGKTYRWELEVVQPVTFAVVTNVIASQGHFLMRISTQVETEDRMYPRHGKMLHITSTYDADNVAGVFSGTVTVPADWGSDFYVQFGCFNGGAVTFRRVKFEEVPPPPPDDLDGITLYDYCVEIVRRAGLPGTIIDKDSVDSVDPNQEVIGFYADRPITALAALRAPMNSFGADVFTDRSGQYKVSRLRDPALEIPDRQIDRNVIVRESDVMVRPDEAPGLTTSMLAAKNWYVFRDSDFAETGTGLTIEDKESLKRDGRFIRTAILPENEEVSGTGSGLGDRGSFPRLYRHAVNAEPLVSLFDDPDAAAAEIQRVIDLYSTVRQFVEVDVWLDPGDFVDLDEVVFFKYPRYRFDDGKNMIVVGVSDMVESSGRRRIASLILWG